MSGPTRPTLNELFAPLSAALPVLEPAEQRVGVALYRQLARGTPVRAEQVAAALGTASRDVAALLDAEGLRSLIFYDDQRRVIGFGGLAVVEMPHRFRVNGSTAYTWCAWDGLFIPAVLGMTAELESRCPHTGTAIRLVVGPEGIQRADPAATVVSFLLPDAPLFDNPTAETIKTFCHYIHFFASRAAAERWTAHHQGTFVLSLDEAFALGQMNNAVRFGAFLGGDGAKP